VSPVHHKVADVLYVHNAKHRNNTPDSGQWTISEHDERQCFALCLKNKWNDATVGWGLYFDSGKVALLGVDKYGAPSFVAKFIDSGSSGIWHGFPKAPENIPSPKALKDWLDSKDLRKKTLKLLSHGKSCRL